LDWVVSRHRSNSIVYENSTTTYSISMWCRMGIICGFSEYDVKTAKCIYVGNPWCPANYESVLKHCKFLNKTFPNRLFIPWIEEIEDGAQAKNRC